LPIWTIFCIPGVSIFNFPDVPGVSIFSGILLRNFQWEHIFYYIFYQVPGVSIIVKKSKNIYIYQASPFVFFKICLQCMRRLNFLKMLLIEYQAPPFFIEYLPSFHQSTMSNWNFNFVYFSIKYQAPPLFLKYSINLYTRRLY
jgi:hypothetical protein